jgi:hypothetical protein
VDALTLVSEYEVAPAGRVVSVEYAGAPATRRATRKPVSSLEASVQARSIRVGLTAVAVRFVGAASGAAGVVAEAAALGPATEPSRAFTTYS